VKNDVAPRPATHVTALPADYPAVLEELKRRIRTVQLRAAVSVNRELIALHWHIGKSIAERQRSEGWGKSVANRLAKDLQGEFPGMAGFSPSNIQIESDLFGRQSQAVTNFRATLPPPQSDLAQQVLKDPYNFDFLALAADARERELEQGLLAHLRKFLLELGSGFAFVWPAAFP
jgi:predicted nuclease of restriction endonuclease-like (RecB) superfamily